MNLTIFGSSIQAFAEVVTLLEADCRLWSSVCDKKGDWMISTSDRGLTPGLLEKIKPLSWQIVAAGEILTMAEEHPEYEALCASRVIWRREDSEV